MVSRKVAASAWPVLRRSRASFSTASSADLRVASVSTAITSGGVALGAALPRLLPMDSSMPRSFGVGTFSVPLDRCAATAST